MFLVVVMVNVDLAGIHEICFFLDDFFIHGLVSFVKNRLFDVNLLDFELC